MPVAAGIVGDLGVAPGDVLAARDVSPERRRATALDRVHHLQLLEAHMGAVGLAPSRAVIAEDIRDLQSWQSHWPAALRRRRIRAVSPRTPAARWAQALKGALDLGNHSGRRPTVAGRRLELVVSEQRLDDADIRAALKQMGGEAVARRMQRDRLAQPRSFGSLL